MIKNEIQKITFLLQYCCCEAHSVSSELCVLFVVPSPQSSLHCSVLWIIIIEQHEKRSYYAFAFIQVAAVHSVWLLKNDL